MREMIATRLCSVCREALLRNLLLSSGARAAPQVDVSLNQNWLGHQATASLNQKARAPSNRAGVSTTSPARGALSPEASPLHRPCTPATPRSSLDQRPRDLLAPTPTPFEPQRPQRGCLPSPQAARISLIHTLRLSRLRPAARDGVVAVPPNAPPARVVLEARVALRSLPPRQSRRD